MFVGVCFRFHDPRWACDPLSGLGAAKIGGRFNVKGEEALYLGLSLATAFLEVKQGRSLVSPYTLVSYEVSVSQVADLRAEAERTTLGVAAIDLACAWKSIASTGRTPPSWEVATALKARGFEGALIPSFALDAGASDHNLVLWRWNKTTSCNVAVFDPDNRLPKNQDSWAVH